MPHQGAGGGGGGGGGGGRVGSGCQLQPVWRLAFESAVDAVRFCHAAQVRHTLVVGGEWGVGWPSNVQLYGVLHACAAAVCVVWCEVLCHNLCVCHPLCCQVALMYSRCWLDGSFAAWIGRQEHSPEGRPLFQVCGWMHWALGYWVAGALQVCVYGGVRVRVEAQGALMRIARLPPVGS